MKLKKYLKKKNYLVQLLLTIAGMVCMPLIVMQLLMMEQSTQGYSRLNEENIHENLKESTDYFVRQIEKMSSTAIKVSQDATIRKAAKENSSEYNIYEAALKIKEYNSDDWSMGVWFYDNESILFNQVRISPERLYEMIGGEDKQCRDAMKEFFEVGEHTRITSTAEYAEGEDAFIVAAGSIVMALNGPAITSIQSGKIIVAMKEKCSCDTYISGITYRPQILMVCVLYGEMEPEHLRELAGELLKEITGHEYSIQCGNVVENITDIRNSYLKTLTNTAEQDGKRPELNSAVAEAIQKFGESMYSGDAAKIQKLLDVVKSRLSTIQDSDALKNYYCDKLMTVYFANAKDSQNLKEEMARLIAFTDTRQLFVML